MDSSAGVASDRDNSTDLHGSPGEPQRKNASRCGLHAPFELLNTGCEVCVHGKPGSGDAVAVSGPVAIDEYLRQSGKPAFRGFAPQVALKQMLLALDGQVRRLRSPMSGQLRRSAGSSPNGGR